MNICSTFCTGERWRSPSCWVSTSLARQGSRSVTRWWSAMLLLYSSSLFTSYGLRWTSNWSAVSSELLATTALLCNNDSASEGGRLRSSYPSRFTSRRRKSTKKADNQSLRCCCSVLSMIVVCSPVSSFLVWRR